MRLLFAVRARKRFFSFGWARFI